MFRIIPFILLVIFFIGSAWAIEMPVNKVHLENEISCADCHGTATPERRAPASACINCHGEIPGAVKSYDDAGTAREINVHDSHDGQLRCTLCHRIHEESIFYCADCHQFDVKVP